MTGGGHYSQRIAFAPDGTIFLSSGERQKMTPAQDPNSDLGKVLHMTAEGQRDRRAPLQHGPPQPARPRLRARRAAVGNRNGPEGRRRGQSDRAGQELRLAGGVVRQPLRRPRHPRRSQGPRLRGAQGLVEPVSLAGRAADLHRRPVPAVEGRCADRRACRAKRSSASTSTGTRRGRPTNGRWARASARSTRARAARSICSRMGRAAAACCGSSRRASASSPFPSAS